MRRPSKYIVVDSEMHVVDVEAMVSFISVGETTDAGSGRQGWKLASAWSLKPSTMPADIPLERYVEKFLNSIYSFLEQPRGSDLLSFSSKPCHRSNGV
jgi:hypothetical protein